MISSELVFVQLSQFDGYVGAMELAMMLETSAMEVRQVLRDLGDLVKGNDNDQWRVIRNISPDRILSVDERAERDRLEQTVEQSFVTLGNALKTLRDKRLYRETHSTFEAYVRDRFDFTRAAAYYLIRASEVVDNLRCQQFVDTNKHTVLPTRESQCRPLAKLSPQRQREVWFSAVEQAGDNKVPSARLIKSVIKQNYSDSDIDTKPKNHEVIYKPGTGIDYVVHLDEETYKMLQVYQDKIGSATKNGAIRRLLNDAIAN
ncbi:MAG: hypothetical protein WBM44_11260 [Waterburya sp.]